MDNIEVYKRLKKVPVIESNISNINDSISENTNDIYSTRYDGFYREKDTLENFTAWNYTSFYNKFDALMNNGNTHLIRRRTMGYDSSGTLPVYLYLYEPPSFDKTVFVVGGVHGNEKFGSFACLKLFEKIVDKSNSDIVFSNLRRCRVLCIPVVNPYGMSGSGSTRYNYNHVDINRNFDWKWSTQPPECSDPSSIYYKGTAPFSEKETQYIKQVADEYIIDSYFDLHNTTSNTNPFGEITLFGDDKTSKVCRDMINFAIKGVENPVYNYTVSNNDSSSNNWVSYVKGIPSINVEGEVRSDYWDETRAKKWFNIYINTVNLGSVTKMSSIRANKSITLSNGWSTTSGYKSEVVENNGFVSINMTLTNTSFGNDIIAFTLDSSCIPKERVYVPISYKNTGGTWDHGIAFINTDGKVMLTTTSLTTRFAINVGYYI